MRRRFLPGGVAYCSKSPNPAVTLRKNSSTLQAKGTKKAIDS